MYQLITTVFILVIILIILRDMAKAAKIMRRQQMQIDVMYGLHDQMMRHLSQIEQKEDERRGERIG